MVPTGTGKIRKDAIIILTRMISAFTADEKKIKFDGVFIAIHGTPGENGLLQGYFDMMGIPYTSCNAFCSALTFNKQACKLFLKEYGITMAKAILIRKGDEL